jgi:phosphatidylcholine synthase
LKKILAWLVHLYTASGGIFALLSIIAIDDQRWALSLTWLMICFFIDGTDGLLARKFQVSATLPYMDGKSIDYVIDFLTYAFVPAYFVYRSGLVPASLSFYITSFILLTSAIYYGKQGMVSNKKQFKGFPVLWNLVVFYTFFIFQSGPVFNVFFILFFGVLHFVPIEVSYPSKNLKENPLPFIIGTGMLVVFVSILWQYPVRNEYLILSAWLAFAYFISLTIYYTWFRQEKS